MKKILILSILLCVTALQAQTTKPTFITGDLGIKYNSRLYSGSNDVYTINVNVCNSAVFKGTITDIPAIAGGVMTASRTRSLKYDMLCDVVNPANPAQTKNVGRIYGIVPIDQNGIYRYDLGNLQVAVYQMGTARGFESKFGGTANGKPPVKALGMVEKMQKSAQSITKQVQGKTVTVLVKKYDKLDFHNHVLAAGPVQVYQEVTVNGEMMYDYDRYAWYFRNVTILYVVDGRQMVDRLTGDIRWVAAANRNATGEGEYQFDVRVNEPPPNESAVFAGPSDESAFFSTDETIPSLTGTMKYKDVISGETTTSSTVKIDLKGNKLTKQQVMCLCKLLVFSSVVPLNAD